MDGNLLFVLASGSGVNKSLICSLTIRGAAEDSHDFVDVSFKFHFMFDYCDNAVSAYSRINLYSFWTDVSELPQNVVTLRCCLIAFEEKLHLPSVLVKEHNLFGRQEEIICVKTKLLFRSGIYATIRLIREG